MSLVSLVNLNFFYIYVYVNMYVYNMYIHVFLFLYVINRKVLLTLVTKATTYLFATIYCVTSIQK